MLPLFLREYRLCDSQFLDTELKFLKDSFSKLAYPAHFINEAHKKAKQRFYCPEQRPEPEQLPTLCLPYNKTGLNLLKPILKSQNVR